MVVVSAPIRAVVFDLDGLMVNTEEVFHLTGHELMRRRGKVATQELFNAMMGRRARESATPDPQRSGVADSRPPGDQNQ